MIAVSSPRPHSDREYARNQRRAIDSWVGVFSSIHYFGTPEPELQTNNVFWHGSDWPTIREMTRLAGDFHQSDYSAIINADIVVGTGLFDVEYELKKQSILAATSYRWEYDPEETKFLKINQNRDKNDRGMDIFIANPEIWRIISKAVPPYLRIGHPTWDTWVCGFFCDRLGTSFRQFTDRKVIFHPRHGGRKTPYADEIRNDEKYFTLAKRPSPL